jgi:hypothetical protein
MTWTDHFFFKADSREPTGRMDFLVAAYSLINSVMVDDIKAFYAAAGRSSPTSLLAHLDGTHTVYVTVTDLFPLLGRHIAGHAPYHVGHGHLYLDRTYLNCLQATFDNGPGTDPLCALIDCAVTLILHETGHMVWHGEDFCSALEGFVRHGVQASFGFFVTSGGVVTTTNALCAQTQWTCGGDHTSATCSGSALQSREKAFGDLHKCEPS